MNYHKLLQKQIQKHLPRELAQEPELQKFLISISASYNAYERDKEFVERAFNISEEEYEEINEKLKHEIEVKRQSVEKLKETIGTVTGEEENKNADDLLVIARYLDEQVHKRKDAEKRWQFALEGAGDGVWEYDLKTKEAFYSIQYKRMLGYEEEEFENKPGEWLTRIHPDEIVLIEETNKNYIEKKITSHQREYRVMHKDGNYRWILDRGMVVGFDESGRPRRFIGTHTDITERKKSEDEYRRISVVASANDNGVVFTDAAGKIIWSNDGFDKLTGYSHAEIIGQNALLLYKGEMCEGESFDMMLNAFSEGRSFNTEIVHYRKNGTFFWGRIIGQPTFDKIGNVVQYFAIIEDISYEKEQERQFRSLAENVPGILYRYEYHLNGGEGFTYISPDGARKIGVSEEQLKSFYSIIHPDDLEKEKQVSKRSRTEKSPYQFEGRFLLPGKQPIWLNITSSYTHTTADGSVVHMGIIINTTKEKEAELTLQKNEEKYRSIIANMNLGLLEVDLNDHIQFANQGFCEMSGYELGQLTGKTASSLFVSNGTVELMRKKNELRTKSVSDAYEISIKNKAGESKWWLVSGAPRFNECGEVIGSLGIHLDITNQKEMELQLIEARKQAELSADAKQNFLANMSHEIRTPMNAIIGMSRQLRKTTLDQQQNLFLKTITHAAENLLVVINDILDTSKIEAGKLKLEKIGFRMPEVIKRAIQVMRLRAEEKGLVIISHIDRDIAPVFIGDPYRLNQVLLNLLSNSVKFSDKGCISIICKLVTYEYNGQLLQITVSDNGIGMEKDFLKNVFQSFSQEDRSVSRKYGGTGLGMSITKQLVGLMGGTIEAKSEKNKGTDIIITIPFEIGEASDVVVHEIKISDKGILKNKRILLAEDNDMNRLVATTTLSTYGTIITEVMNGLEAIEAIRRSKYDLVLMDMQMPVMDGLEATAIIRKQLKSDIPIIALTANAIKGENDRCIAAGMNDYISKPFDEDTLVNIMAKWLGDKSSATESRVLIEAVKLYDLSRLRELSMGNEEFVRKMIILLEKEIPVVLAELQEGFEENDFAKMASAAHRVRPSLDYMGVDSLKSKINKIERLAREKQYSDQFPLLIREVGDTLRKVRIGLQNEKL